MRKQHSLMKSNLGQHDSCFPEGVSAMQQVSCALLSKLSESLSLFLLGLLLGRYLAYSLASWRLLWPKCFSKPKDRKEELLHSEDDPELQNLRWELRVAFWKPQVQGFGSPT